MGLTFPVHGASVLEASRIWTNMLWIRMILSNQTVYNRYYHKIEAPPDSMAKVFITPVDPFVENLKWHVFIIIIIIILIVFD